MSSDADSSLVGPDYVSSYESDSTSPPAWPFESSDDEFIYIDGTGPPDESSEIKYGGYEFEFVLAMDGNLEDIFMCKICHLPSRNAQLSVCCGHTFCKSCLDRMKHSTTSSKACPVCRKKKFEIVANKQVDRKIRSLHVFCTNKEKGCRWQGELNDIDSHISKNNSKGCVYEHIECKHGCGETLQRQHITKHMKIDCSHRKVNCQYCNLSGAYHFITGDHKETCPKVVVQCPNHCEVDNILREEMDEHRKVCSLEVVSCKYLRLGCGTRIARKEMEQHSHRNIERHLQLTTERLEKLEHTVSKLENVVSQLVWFSRLASMASDSELQVTPVIIRITEFNTKKFERYRWKSPHFYTDNGGFDMYMKVNFASSYLKIYMSLGLNDDDQLRWPLRGTFEIKLLNQISDAEHYSRRIVYDDRCPDNVAGRDAVHSWGISRFISYWNLCSSSSTCQYVKSDSVYLKVTYYGPEH